MALEQEVKTYERERESLLQHEGKYALVQGNDVAGVFDTYADALKAGYEKYGLAPFLVKHIESVEQAQFFTRPLSPCHT